MVVCNECPIVRIWKFEVDHNDMLTSLTGLDNIDSESINSLRVVYNPMLSTCNVQSICDYLETSGASVQIYNNAPGCNSQDEVIDSCNIVPVQEFNIGDNQLTISPNPCTVNDACLRFTLHTSRLTMIDLYSISGQKIKRLLNEVMLPETYEMEVDLSELPAGVYFCTMQTVDRIETVKVIKF